MSSVATITCSKINPPHTISTAPQLILIYCKCVEDEERDSLALRGPVVKGSRCCDGTHDGLMTGFQDEGCGGWFRRHLFTVTFDLIGSDCSPQGQLLSFITLPASVNRDHILYFTFQRVICLWLVLTAVVSTQ